jgi:hypothetical protein
MTQTVDFFRARLDAMIDLRHPLAVLASRLPWLQLETELAPSGDVNRATVCYQKAKIGLVRVVCWLLRG